MLTTDTGSAVFPIYCWDSWVAVQSWKNECSWALSFLDLICVFQ